MRCLNCNTEFDGERCPNCGRPADAAPQELVVGNEPVREEGPHRVQVRRRGDAPTDGTPYRVVTIHGWNSPLLAVATLVLYFVAYPFGLLANLVGLVTGPRRGCFLAMLTVFFLLPVVIIFAVLGWTIPMIIRALSGAWRWLTGPPA